ncbi:MAG: hypothetical protein IPH77_20960 [Ignavibacteria bacterium]|nr:hypothetical protein [Ignavibacteria bacterium]
MDDTVRVYLRNNLFPYAVVDSAKAVVNSFLSEQSFSLPMQLPVLIIYKSNTETQLKHGAMQE